MRAPLVVTRPRPPTSSQHLLNPPQASSKMLIVDLRLNTIIGEQACQERTALHYVISAY